MTQSYHDDRIEDRKDPIISDLDNDARLPQETQDVLEKRLELAATTAAKMMRAAHHGQSALNRARLFPCEDKDGKEIAPDPITYRDGTSIQILKKLAKQVKLLEETELGEDETELERNVKIANILSQMTKQQATMEQNIAKAVGLSTKAQQEAAKLQFAMQAHRDKMELVKDKDMTAAEIERIADA